MVAVQDTPVAPVAGGVPPREKALPEEERAAMRRRLVESTPWWYSPLGHFAVPTLFGFAIVAGCVRLLEPVAWWHWLAIPATYLVANINEWRAHKHLLHRRNRFAPVLYDRHTPQHHMLYLTSDLAIRDRREFRLVLIPAYGIGLLFVATTVPAALLWLVSRNLALFFVATSMLYVLSYEWLHLSYHLPPESFVGRLAFVRWLRNHHAVHHDPTVMQRYNFNVTVPIWDWVKGTSIQSAAEATPRESSAAGPA